MTQIFCAIRKNWVAGLPEEKVRQEILVRMIEQLGYPKSLIAVEKGLSQMPHLQLKPGTIPDRRADILCFDHQMVPLLLIECKSIPLTDKVINQVVGYNAHVRARYIAIANQTQVRTGWYDENTKGYAFVERLPAYAELCKSVTCP